MKKRGRVYAELSYSILRGRRARDSSQTKTSWVFFSFPTLDVCVPAQGPSSSYDYSFNREARTSNPSSPAPFLPHSYAEFPQHHSRTIFLHAQRLHQSAPRLMPGPYPTSVDPRLHLSPRGCRHFLHVPPRVSGGARYAISGLPELVWRCCAPTPPRLAPLVGRYRGCCCCCCCSFPFLRCCCGIAVVDWLMKGCVDRFPCPLRAPGRSAPRTRSWPCW